MAVKRIHQIEKYIGLSTDTKPSDAMVGSEYWERDTKNTYIVYSKTAGVSDWSLKGD
jgi:hypothetical protein